MLESEKLVGSLKSSNPISGNIKSNNEVNGSSVAKGEPGPAGKDGKNAYVHIKYSENYPTNDSDISDEINNYIGIYTDNNEVASDDFTKYHWMKITGKDGKDGEPGPVGKTGETGISIETFEKISTVGLVDTYRLSFSNGTYKDFTITNGKNGTDGINGVDGKNGIDGEQNVIEKIKVNNTELTITEKTVNITIPTQISDLDGYEDLSKKEYIEQINKNLKIDIINMTQDFIFYDNGSGSSSFYYNLQKLYRMNLIKVEIGYTTSSSLTANPIYNEVSIDSNSICGSINTNVTGTTIYIWIRLTYSDIGQVILYQDASSNRYSTYISDSSGSGGLACFTGDTEILTENGLKLIKDIKLNDKIETSSGLQEVTKKYEHITDKIYKIMVKNMIIKSSYSHPFITKRGKIIAKDLIVGDVLFDINRNEVVIEDITVSNDDTVVYEINSAVDNYYITNKFILVNSENLR